MESYKRLNMDLALQLQEMKRKVTMLEARATELTLELLGTKRIVIQQQNTIESFVQQISLDLNQYLTSFMSDHDRNALSVAEFIQNVSVQLQELLLGVGCGQNKTTQNRPTEDNKPALQEEQKISESFSEEEPEEKVETKDTTVDEKENKTPIETLDEKDMFVTKRSRGRTQYASEVPEVAVEPPKIENEEDLGLLATIYELSCEESQIINSIRFEPPENDENSMKMVSSTPLRNRKSRELDRRTVLSPLDCNKSNIDRRTRKYSKKPKISKDLESIIDSTDAEITDGLRPRRSNSTKTYTEPSLRSKMRR